MVCLQEAKTQQVSGGKC